MSRKEARLEGGVVAEHLEEAVGHRVRLLWHVVHEEEGEEDARDADLCAGSAGWESRGGAEEQAWSRPLKHH